MKKPWDIPGLKIEKRSAALYPWRVMHESSGLCAVPRGEGFKLRKQARAYVQAIGPHADWTQAFDNPELLTRELATVCFRALADLR